MDANTRKVATIVLLVVGVGAFTGILLTNMIPIAPVGDTILDVYYGESEHTSYALSQIQSMPEVSGEGRFLKSTGAIVGGDTYTGVNVTYLLEQSIELPDEFAVEAVSSDGYTTYFNSTEIRGLLPGYDGETGEPLGRTQFSLVLAYEKNGEPLDESEGPLRLVALNDDGHVADGHFWAKYVNNITVLDAVTPFGLQLNGVEEWEMSHDIYYSLASCPHHRKNITIGTDIFEGVALWTIVAAMDGADDEHYEFNISLVSTDYDVVTYDEGGNNMTFEINDIVQSSDFILAGWKNGALLDGDDWPLMVVTSDGQTLGNIVQVEMVGWDV